MRGCLVLRPYGYGLWERLQAELDARFKDTGHENAYFPLLIPESLLVKEAEHVEGFAPGSRVGHAKAAAKSSPSGSPSGRRRKSIIGTMYAEWVQSYRDLPILINQWANVMRWEKARGRFCARSNFCGKKATRRTRPSKRRAKKSRACSTCIATSPRTSPRCRSTSARRAQSERFAGATTRIRSKR